LRTLRLKRGLTQAELGRRLGYAYPSSISSIENARRPVYREELTALAKALGCDPDELIPEPRDETVTYPTRRSRRHLLTLAMLSLSNLAANELRAEGDGGNVPYRLLPFAGESEPRPHEDPRDGTGEDRNPLIWGDNCDPTLLPRGDRPTG
jgi:transcriptional regulator with XRE-family HTH domain